MSQDAWIADVQAEVEQSSEFRVLRDMISGWYLDPEVGPFTPRPEWIVSAFDRLAVLGDGVRIAEEAGRRYQRALNAWRYRQG